MLSHVLVTPRSHRTLHEPLQLPSLWPFKVILTFPVHGLQRESARVVGCDGVRGVWGACPWVGVCARASTQCTMPSCCCRCRTQLLSRECMRVTAAHHHHGGRPPARPSPGCPRRSLLLLLLLLLLRVSRCAGGRLRAERHARTCGVRLCACGSFHGTRRALSHQQSLQCSLETCAHTHTRTHARSHAHTHARTHAHTQTWQPRARTHCARCELQHPSRMHKCAPRHRTQRSWRLHSAWGLAMHAQHACNARNAAHQRGMRARARAHGPHATTGAQHTLQLQLQHTPLTLVRVTCLSECEVSAVARCVQRRPGVCMCGATHTHTQCVGGCRDVTTCPS
jgi:hypothetical protein